MPAILKNNAVSRLAASITIDDLQLSVSAGDGSKFPALTAGQWFPLTLMRADGSLEIIRVNARNGDVMTVVRGQEATAPLAFTAGDRVEMRITADLMNGKLDKEGGDGGDGGRAVSDYGPGSFGVGGVLTVTVPTGGNGGAGQVAGAKGTNGAVYISWT